MKAKNAWRSALLAGFCAITAAMATPPELAPQPGVLLLRTGRILRGDIIRVGDRYLVGQQRDNEIGIPVDQVEFRCKDLVEAYERQRSALPTETSVSDHLDLADWCLRYDLHAQAAAQLMEAMDIDPRAEGLAVLERRLKVATHRVSQTPARPSRTTNSPLGARSVTTGAELPPGVIEQFTTTIQPLLVNRCGGAGCHGSRATNTFRLQIPSWSRVFPRRFTVQNLSAVRAWIHSERPSESPLLTMATRAHGGVRAPIRETNVEQMKELVGWVFRMSGRTTHAQLEIPASAQSILRQPTAQRVPSGMSTDTVSEDSRSGDGSPGRHREAGPPPSTRDGPADRPGRAPLSSPASSSPATGSPKGVDPFDPAIFNRRFGDPKANGRR